MDEYFYIDNDNNQIGPVSVDELRGKGISPTTPVWKNGMEDWTPAGKVDELSSLFAEQPPQYEASDSGQQAYYQQQPPYQQSPYANQGYGYQQPPYQQPSYQQPYGPRPDSWLVWSILTTIFCFLPTGVAAIVFSAQVDSYWGQGRYEDARRAAKRAKILNIIGAAVAVGGVLIYLVIFVFCMLLGAGLSASAYAY